MTREQDHQRLVQQVKGERAAEITRRARRLGIDQPATTHAATPTVRWVLPAAVAEQVLTQLEAARGLKSGQTLVTPSSWLPVTSADTALRSYMSWLMVRTRLVEMALSLGEMEIDKLLTSMSPLAAEMRQELARRDAAPQDDSAIPEPIQIPGADVVTDAREEPPGG